MFVCIYFPDCKKKMQGCQRIQTSWNKSPPISEKVMRSLWDARAGEDL